MISWFKLHFVHNPAESTHVTHWDTKWILTMWNYFRRVQPFQAGLGYHILCYNCSVMLVARDGVLLAASCINNDQLTHNTRGQCLLLHRFLLKVWLITENLGYKREFLQCVIMYTRFVHLFGMHWQIDPDGQISSLLPIFEGKYMWLSVA